jgi:hypothetical protein
MAWVPLAVFGVADDSDVVAVRVRALAGVVAIVAPDFDFASIPELI